MEAVSWSAINYKPTTLPKLSTTNEISRRHSISSSAGDSGYLSDRDISLSPQDFVGPADYVLYPAYPNSPTLGLSGLKSIVEDTITSNHTKRQWPREDGLNLFKKCVDGERVLPQKPLVTSDPHFSTCNEIESKSERVSSIVSISSTGSGGYYSVTDDSEFEEDLDSNPTMLSKSILKTIELILRKVEVNLTYAAYMQCANGQPSTSKSNGANESLRRGSAQGSNNKRKSRGDDSLQPDDRDEDGSNKRRKMSTTTSEESENGPRYACPFFKHAPNRYRNRRTCTGPGWPTVHRMKEHLYRNHAQPIYCPRCYIMFDGDGDLANHLRSEPGSEPCHLSAPQPIDGIDRETLTKLHKRSSASRIGEDKWRDTYQLLFPDVAEADIPSPYYDSGSPTEESRRFRRELLHRVRQALFTTAEQESGPVEQNLLRQVADIIQRCETDLLNSFYPAPGPNRPAQVSQVPPHSNSPDLPITFPVALPTTSPFLEYSTFDINNTWPQLPIIYANGPPDYTNDVPLQLTQLIDWSAQFPPGPDSQERNDSKPTFTTPVYS